MPKGTKRSAFNKNGSPRKKPGPKSKNAASSPFEEILTAFPAWNSEDTEAESATPKKRGAPKGTKKSAQSGKKADQKFSEILTAFPAWNSEDIEAKPATPKKRGVPKGTKRSAFNKDGSPRKKPGPKPKTGVE